MPPTPNTITLPGLYGQATDLWDTFRVVRDVARELAWQHARGAVTNSEYLTAVTNLRAEVRERTAPLIAALIVSVESYASDEGADTAIEESIRSSSGALIEGRPARLDDVVGGVAIR